MHDFYSLKAVINDEFKTFIDDHIESKLTAGGKSSAEGSAHSAKSNAEKLQDNIAMLNDMRAKKMRENKRGRVSKDALAQQGRLKDAAAVALAARDVRSGGPDRSGPSKKKRRRERNDEAGGRSEDFQDAIKQNLLGTKDAKKAIAAISRAKAAVLAAKAVQIPLDAEAERDALKRADDRKSRELTLKEKAVNSSSNVFAKFMEASAVLEKLRAVMPDAPAIEKLEAKVASLAEQLAAGE